METLFFILKLSIDSNTGVPYGTHIAVNFPNNVPNIYVGHPRTEVPNLSPIMHPFSISPDERVSPKVLMALILSKITKIY